ncbi:hypothetical protein KL931_000781 [Ogataea haglerorum]|nr:hypothetical protein KL912_000727 [Ogataea haglerorum]KAG7771083.1 hypothetical protein KL931_000781 [Ogataea haglerorum]KAG7787228.1 hypothetical protein KL910_003890 [Ogataea haglerorum]KAG7788932.1 hypothetical protein KL945_002371 [Ogataea haglerorum]KAG7804810.1 hypothetical protein KL944_000556 [Ogataea haglerorum]
MTSSNYATPFLVRLFRSLDTLIALRYSTNYLSSLVRFSTVSKQVLNLNLEVLCTIKSIYPESYDIARAGDDITIDVFCEESADRSEERVRLIQKIEKRQQIFRAKLEEWTAKGCPITFKLDSEQKHQASPKKISKIIKPKNSRTKYEFHERQVLSDLPLLERIKMKQASKKVNNLSDNKQEPLESKLIPIYNVIYEQSPKFNSSKTVSLSVTRLQQLVRDSMKLPVSETDVRRVLFLLAEKLGLRLTVIGETQILKIPQLNRNEDLAKLGSRQVGLVE